MKIFLQAASSLKGEAVILGDKSIAHRAVILSALACGKTVIKNFPPNDDCLFTVKAFQKLGIKINLNKDKVEVVGKGLFGLTKPKSDIFLGNSGTSFRILLGALAGQPFKTTLKAAQGLSKRPMHRVIYPLQNMGARFSFHHSAGKSEIYPPVTIKAAKGHLKGLPGYSIPVASAQVKSAILFAGLYAKNKICIEERIKTRDHTERMLESFGVDINVSGNKVKINPVDKLVSPGKIVVPGDISAAAFFMVLAAICKNSEITIKDVGLNPTRIGILNVLKRMNADIKITRRLQPITYHLLPNFKYEPTGDIVIKSSQLRAAIVNKEEIPSLIDELPILMVAACFAQGVSRFEGVEELRVKETDRIKAMEYNLSKMGADIQVFSGSGNYQSVAIRGTGGLKGAKVKSFNDHRTAMSMVVAGLVASGRTEIDDISCIHKSFPGFMDVIKKLS